MNATTVRRTLNRRVAAIVLALLLTAAAAAAPLVELGVAHQDAGLPLLACEGSQCGGGGGG
jgi:hypothetical protein